MSGSKSSTPAAGSPHAELKPLGLSVHGIATPDLSDSDIAARDRVRKGRLRMLLVLAVCAAPVLASYFTYFVIRPQARSNYGDLILPTRSLPESLALTQLDGQAVSARSLRGQWLLVSVGPSACDTACEQRLFMQRQLREMLGRERDRVDKVWFITDSAPLAPALAVAIVSTPAVTALRADREALAQWLAPAAGHALEDHLYLVDPMGEWMMRMPAQADPAKVKRDLERLLRASAFWDTPGR
jgi:cytochrome oxidase Cu insertion factor (SCO1/SenC/PrrC family)